MTSNYYVDSFSVDKETKQQLFDVTSDVGNKYTFIVDTTNSLMKIVSDNQLIVFMIEAKWKP